MSKEQYAALLEKLGHIHAMLHDNRQQMGRIEDLQWCVIDLLDELLECGQDQAKLQALSARVKSKTKELKAAVKAATPPPPIAPTP